MVLWKGNIGIAHQHLATQIAMSHMDRLRSLFSSSNDGSSFRVLVGCVEGEQHFLGARMIADLFLVKGWLMSFLGPDVPTSAILDMINVKRPQLVTLSVTGTQGVSHVQRLLKHIGRLPDAPKVLLGGQAFSRASRGSTVTKIAASPSISCKELARPADCCRAIGPEPCLKST